MSRIKLKQILSNLHYNEELDQLILSGSKIPTANTVWNDAISEWEVSFGNWDGTRVGIPDFIISGTIEVTQSLYNPGGIVVDGVGIFGDTGSFCITGSC